MSEPLQHLSDRDQARAHKRQVEIRHLHSVRLAHATVEEIFEEEDNSNYSNANSKADSEAKAEEDSSGNQTRLNQGTGFS